GSLLAAACSSPQGKEVTARKMTSPSTYKLSIEFSGLCLFKSGPASNALPPAPGAQVPQSMYVLMPRAGWSKAGNYGQMTTDVHTPGIYYDAAYAVPEATELLHEYKSIPLDGACLDFTQSTVMPKSGSPNLTIPPQIVDLTAAFPKISVKPQL